VNNKKTTLLSGFLVLEKINYLYFLAQNIFSICINNRIGGTKVVKNGKAPKAL